AADCDEGLRSGGVTAPCAQDSEKARPEGTGLFYAPEKILAGAQRGLYIPERSAAALLLRFQTTETHTD
ncbi:MAG: hypothetical protein R3265_04365, partial [Hyphomonas sp.]|nr:hypothetical protein [Hyphomonas sp.]